MRNQGNITITPPYTLGETEGQLPFVAAGSSLESLELHLFKDVTQHDSDISVYDRIERGPVDSDWFEEMGYTYRHVPIPAAVEEDRLIDTTPRKQPRVGASTTSVSDRKQSIAGVLLNSQLPHRSAGAQSYPVSAWQTSHAMKASNESTTIDTATLAMWDPLAPVSFTADRSQEQTVMQLQPEWILQAGANDGFAFTRKIYNYLVDQLMCPEQHPLFRWDVVEQVLYVSKRHPSGGNLETFKKSANNYGFQREDSAASPFIILRHTKLQSIDNLLQIGRVKKRPRTEI